MVKSQTSKYGANYLRRQNHLSFGQIHILLEEERYMVVVEPREAYCLLITAFYFDHDHALEKKLKHYEKFKEQ